MLGISGIVRIFEEIEQRLVQSLKRSLGGDKEYDSTSWQAEKLRSLEKFRKENADRRPKAHAKYVRISSRKVKIVIDLIRGKNVDEAAAILMYTPKAASPVVLKVLNSAIANAVNNLEMDRKDLYVAEVYANPGPTLKRYVARSRGSASPMLKRTSHISVVLDQKKA